MNNINLVLIVLLIIIPAAFGIFRLPTEMGLSIGAICLALVFANLEQFSEFAFAGFKGKLNNAVKETYAALDQLKELALALTEPIVDELAISGRPTEYIHLKYKLENLRKIEKILRNIGANEVEITNSCSTLLDRVHQAHMKGIFHNLIEANPGKQELFKDFQEWDFDEWDLPKIIHFIAENKLNQNFEVKEWIKDLEYFIDNHDIRRKNNWQS